MKSKCNIWLMVSVVILFNITLVVYMLFASRGGAYASFVDASEVQTRLKEYGYYDGEINGYFDDATVVAIKNFQGDNGISVTGAVNGATAEALGLYMSEQDNYNLYLLAKCIHAEARGEPYIGMVAVGAVILNRVASPDFPNTIYEVIYQPWAFTATHDGQINLEPERAAYQAAQDALNGWDPSYGSLYYYNPNTATSAWIFSKQTVTVIGDHVFAI